jgi:hypothetical protein
MSDEAHDPISPAPAELSIRGGRLSYDGVAVGSVSDGAITLNLGWCREAGLAVRAIGDPENATDRKSFHQRAGLVLDRPAAP